MAIHDAAYGTPPQSWRALRWRLQHLAEERTGRRVRRAGAREDAAWQAATEAVDGTG